MGVQKRILEEKWWPGHDNYIAGIRHSSRTRENTIFDNELKAIFEKFNWWSRRHRWWISYCR